MLQFLQALDCILMGHWYRYIIYFIVVFTPFRETPSAFIYVQELEKYAHLGQRHSYCS